MLHQDRKAKIIMQTRMVLQGYGSIKNQDWAVEIWGEIAKRYNSEIWVGGYDLLNEPVHGDGKAVREIQRRMRDKI